MTLVTRRIVSSSRLVASLDSFTDERPFPLCGSFLIAALVNSVFLPTTVFESMLSLRDVVVLVVSWRTRGSGCRIAGGRCVAERPFNSTLITLWTPVSNPSPVDVGGISVS